MSGRSFVVLSFYFPNTFSTNLPNQKAGISILSNILRAAVFKKRFFSGQKIRAVWPNYHLVTPTVGRPTSLQMVIQNAEVKRTVS